MEPVLRSPPHTPSEPDDEFINVNAILLDRFRVPSQVDLEPLVKSRLREEAEGVTMGQVEDKVVYGNPNGYGLLEDMEEMKRNVAILLAKDSKKAEEIGVLTEGMGEHNKEIVALKQKVKLLTQSSEGYLCIRRRFLDVYRRDVKQIKQYSGSRAIREGNVIAHEGDAVGDAILFDRDQRTDRTIYRELYGLDPAQVLEFHSLSDDGGLFLVLNAHATTLAQGRVIGKDIEDAFQTFLVQVEENWLRPPNKEHNTSLGSAYYTFWNKYGQQAQP